MQKLAGLEAASARSNSDHQAEWVVRDSTRLSAGEELHGDRWPGDEELLSRAAAPGAANRQVVRIVLFSEIVVSLNCADEVVQDVYELTSPPGFAC